MDTSFLKLPRTDLAPTDLAKIEALLQVDVRPICDGVVNSVSWISFTPSLQEALQVTLRTGCLTQGLESITKVLEDEKKGLDEVQKRTGLPANRRMSRLVFVSNDGSERFYRQVASMLTAHGNRVWCCRLDVTSEVFGRLIAARRNPAKAVMINDKKALAGFFAALARVL